MDLRLQPLNIIFKNVTYTVPKDKGKKHKTTECIYLLIDSLHLMYRNKKRNNNNGDDKKTSISVSALASLMATQCAHTDRNELELERLFPRRLDERKREREQKTNHMKPNIMRSIE